MQSLHSQLRSLLPHHTFKSIDVKQREVEEVERARAAKIEQEVSRRVVMWRMGTEGSGMVGSVSGLFPTGQFPTMTTPHQDKSPRGRLTTRRG